MDADEFVSWLYVRKNKYIFPPQPTAEREITDDFDFDKLSFQWWAINFFLNGGQAWAIVFDVCNITEKLPSFVKIS